MHVTMTQLSMKAGMKRWGRPATKAVSKELQQLHFRDTFEPVNHKTLTKTEYDAVLESHLFLKQKLDDSINGRLVAGGNKQRGTINKEDAASPTAAPMKSGMKRWGSPATKAVSKELQQLHFSDTFEPVNHKTLTVSVR